MRLIWIGLALFVHVSSSSPTGCLQGQVACKSGKCLDSTKRCDHVIDCIDDAEPAADEADCHYACQSPHMQPCSDGHCIAIPFFCDRRNDCGDWSDELNCTGVFPGASISCPTNTFHCEGQSCIPKNWVCDGTDDCADGRDELHCDAASECKNGFQCGKECILNQWVCDGMQDCSDGSDEKECGPDGYMNHGCLPEHGWFSCLSKGIKKCMPISRACDGIAHCDDRSDEGGQCNFTSCTRAVDCKNGCNMTPKGPVCSCPIGWRLDGNTCVDINECLLNPPLCSQDCRNTQGGFQCSCSAGYTLSPRNNQSCIANGPEMALFITTDRDIRSMSLPSKEYGLVQSGISQAHSVSGDFEDGYIYWNEKSKDKAGIFKSMVDGSAHQYVVSVGVEMVEDLAIDWIGRHIYFADSGRKHIVACDSHGTLCTVVLSGQLEKPRAVAVYPEERLMFWSDWGTRAHIGSSGMDGSRRQDIITTDIAWPNGLAVDETINRIFWSDAKLNRIESSRLDGTDRVVLPVTVSHPYAIDIFENTIYWCDPVEHEVLSCDKFTGKNRKVLMKEASLTPTGVHVHHPSKQPHLPNPCWNVICSHLCLLSPSAQGFQCSCPVGMKLNNDNRTCDPLPVQPSAVVIGTFTDLYMLTHHQIGKESIVHLPAKNLENIGALAFNPMGHSIIYSDLVRRVIFSMHLETFRETVLFENADMVEGLDVDPYTENIYWTEVKQGTLLVGHTNHNGEREKVILARELHSPKSIALAPELGLMFIVEGRISHVISVWHMDGGWRQELVQVYGTVSAMAYDRKHLYFSDSLRGTIERIGFDGQDRIILRSHLGSPVAMDASDDSVFWLTQFSPRINWLGKTEPKTTRGFVIDSSEELAIQYRLMTVVDHFGYEDEHVCLGHTGGCSDICAPTPKEAKCLCPIGKELSEDKHICHPVDCVGDQWFKCQSSCIPAKFRCDGINDCPLGEDEVHCSNGTTAAGCTSQQFQCRNGGCIASIFYCDGDFDCHDRSDEPDSCPPHSCMSSSDYACPNQHLCIPRSAMCDGQADCADGSDENCTTTQLFCSSSQFFCKQSRLCIPQAWVCDKDTDCEHGEDEDASFCAIVKSSCPPKYIRCPQRNDCIPRMALCNGVAECEHGTDQDLCAKLNETITEEATFECPAEKFTCYLGANECIPQNTKCDCQFDCTFGEDEEGCGTLPSSCKEELFRCPDEMRYISKSWVCDGLADCTNGADELPALCPSSTVQSPTAKTTFSIGIEPLCSEDEFECVNGECIPSNYTCDGERQCSDGTDEGAGCSTSCSDNGHCPHVCIPGPREPTCLCGPGYQALNEGRHCIDLDECATENTCTQYCNNTKGSYKCSCAPGYQLEQDHRTCKVTSGRPMVIVASIHHVQALLQNDARVLVQSINTIKDIEYYDKTSTLYWVTMEGISRSNSNGIALIYKMNGLVPSGLTLDRATGNLYVSAVISGQDRSIIKVVSKSLNADVNIISTQTIITDVAIDGNQGVLFWSEHSKPHTGRIIRSTMDGKSTMWLHSITKLMYPVAITLDTVQSRIYWADLRLQSISSCDYNGQNQKMVIGNTNGQPLSLAVFENRISWSVLEQGEVRSQVVGSVVSSTTQHLNEPVSHMVISHSVLEPELANPCASNPCNNGVCVLKNSSSFTCYCPSGVPVVSSNPFKCSSRSPVVETVTPDSETGLNPDYIEIPASPGVTVASILICLAVLTILAILGWVYYKRWRRTIGSPLKFRFRNALGLTEESTAWEESVDYSDRKRLYYKNDDHDEPNCGPQVVVDQNDNRTMSTKPNMAAVRCQTDSAYASQQSLAKRNSAADEHQPQQLLPATYSMKDQLLASEL